MYLIITEQIVPIEADQSGHHCVEEAESKYWWLHRSVKPSAPTVDPVMVPYRFTGQCLPELLNALIRKY